MTTGRSAFTVTIEKRLAVLENRNDGWKLELNLVSWNNKPATYDIRPWNEDHTQCGKGICLHEVAFLRLTEYFQGTLMDNIEGGKEDDLK